MIIVEGFDGSGKSTIAQRISAMIGWPVLHTGGPTSDEEDVLKCLVRSRIRMRKAVIQDRVTHISESVYSMLENPRKAALAIRSLHEVRNVTLVYCRPPTHALLDAIGTHRAKAHESAEHVSRVIETAEQLIAIYDTVIAVVAERCDLIHYDWTDPYSETTTLTLIKEKDL